MKKVLFFVLSLLPLLSLTSCWDAYNIKEHSIISLVGVEHNQNNYKFVLEIIDNNKISTKEEGTKKESQSKLLIAEGSSLAIARSNIDNISSSELFLGAIRAIVFSDEYSKYGIEEYLSRIKGNFEYRKTVFLLTSSTKLEKLFDNKITNLENVGFSLERLVTQQNKIGLSYTAMASETIEQSLVNNIGYLINNIEIIDSEIGITGYTIFKNNKKIGFVSNDEKLGVNAIILKNATAHFTFIYNDLTITVSAKFKDKKINALYNEDIEYGLNLTADCEIESTSKQEMFEKEDFDNMKTIISAYLEEQITSSLQTSSKKHGCDYLYLYTYFRAKYGSLFNNIDYDAKYKNAKFNVKVKTNLSAGNMINMEK